MNEPTPPTDRTPPSERIQFTMRTFFVAALWISVAFAGNGALTFVDQRAGLACTAVWWILWTWISLWWVAGILRSPAMRAAMILGTLLDCAAIIATFCASPPDVSVAVVMDRYERLFQTVFFSLLWGVQLGAFVGISLMITGLGRRAARNAWQSWTGRMLLGSHGPRSQRWVVAGAMAIGHLIVSLVLILVALIVAKTPPESPILPWYDRHQWFYTLTSIIDQPVGCIASVAGVYQAAELMDLDWRVFYAAEGVLRFALVHHVPGIVLYFFLGWSIGWWLDRRTARLAAEPNRAVGQGSELAGE